MSYVNLIMYNAVLPTYNENESENKNKNENVINADDPESKNLVHNILFSE